MVLPHMTAMHTHGNPSIMAARLPLNHDRGMATRIRFLILYYQALFHFLVLLDEACPWFSFAGPAGAWKANFWSFYLSVVES
jgi:hypothetical protein